MLSSKGIRRLLSQQQGAAVLEELDISDASRIGIQVSLELLWNVLEKKKRLQREIFLAGEPLQEEVKRLITIKGITPLTALAFWLMWET